MLSVLNSFYFLKLRLSKFCFSKQNTKQKINLILFTISLLVLILPLFADIANAAVSPKLKFAENNPISDTMCKVYYTVTGSIAKVVAVFVITITALGFFLGKVSWGISVAIAIAISLMFGGRKLLGYSVGPKAKSGCQCKAGTYGYGNNCQARPVDEEVDYAIGVAN